METGAGFGAHSEALVFLECFADFPDPRQCGKVIYPLKEILLLCLLAVLAGAEGFVDIALFGRQKIGLLRRFLPFKDGTPSHDQLGDIFAVLDAAEFQRRFVAWVAKLTGVSADVIAIDGKTVRRSFHKRRGKAAIHMVSAFATRQRLVLGQVKVADKSNEIVAIPALLDMLAIEGAVVTIDAMGSSATSPRRSSTRRPITSSPSKATRARCAKMSSCSRTNRRPTALRTPMSPGTKPSTLTTAASKPEPIR
jgi:predicted transposase YbfD/YdcC